MKGLDGCLRQRIPSTHRVLAMSEWRSAELQDQAICETNIFPLASDQKMKTNLEKSVASAETLQLKKLTLEQVKRIDEVLNSLGDYGELHLIIQNGELRYINRVQSFSARNIEPKE